jgi:hypothetical protein
MCRHEEKSCPRCGNGFECKPGSITGCQCYGVMLNNDQRAMIEERYNDCLCRNCLLEFKDPCIFFKEKYLLK